MTAPRISSSADRRIRYVSTGATVVVALSAAVLSWRGLTMLGHNAGLGDLAVLLPLVIDGFMLVGALHVLHSELTGVSTVWGWTMTLAGVTLSTWGNVAAAPATTPASAIVHAVPALALAATVEATMRIIRRGIGEGAEGQDHALTQAEDQGVNDIAPESLEHDEVPVVVAPHLPVVLHAHVERATAAASERKALAASAHVDIATPESPEIPDNVRAMGEWMATELRAGRSTSAGAAVKAEVATSESTARRLQAKAKEAGLVTVELARASR